MAQGFFQAMQARKEKVRKAYGMVPRQPYNRNPDIVKDLMEKTFLERRRLTTQTET